MALTNLLFDLNINSADAAMVEAPDHELPRVLRGLADKIESLGVSGIEHDGRVYDTNGNAIGVFTFDIEEAEEDDAPDLDPDSVIAVSYETRGTYGSEFTPCRVFVAEDYNGARWYVVEGAAVVNCTYCDVLDGVDVEELPDQDCFTVNGGIGDLDALIEHVAEYLSE